MAKKEQPVETPLMKQYLDIKAKYPGAILLFRVGDFYETFGEDAVKTAQILGIVLTKRANGSAAHIELAGFPHHSLDTYLPKLVRAGQRVAICDQLEDPKLTKKIVKRGVTELVTPGVSYNDKVLDHKQNNYLCAIHFEAEGSAAAFLDISTGEFMTSQGSHEYIEKLVQGLKPAEIILSKKQQKQFQQLFGDGFYTFMLDEWVFQYQYAFDKLTQHFNTPTLKGYGIQDMPLAIIAAGVCLHYLNETHHNQLNHIQAVSRIDEDKYVWLDRFTISNLELLYPNHDHGKALIDVLDETVTPMGARLLKKWLVLPLKEKQLIDERLQIVYAVSQDNIHLTNLTSELKQLGDLERMVSKVAMRRINPRELAQLNRSLKHIIPIKASLLQSTDSQLQKLGHQIIDCHWVIETIDKTLKADPPALLHKGELINDGIHHELDELRKIAYHGKDYLLQIQQTEQQKTGIPSLKVAFNNVFGYYLEVTNVHKGKVPAEWIRKQTLTNAERYITEELKQYEEKILGAEEKISAIEEQLFHELVNSLGDYVHAIQANASILAKIDCLCCFAHIANKNHYTKPEINTEHKLVLKDSRHPVIEKQLPIGEKYVPNDIYLDRDSQQIIILTGPNMAGKSALLRQTALNVIMAQIGSFVPASYAQIGLVDKIFTRVGASDNISSGESTFMVEMTETASILNNLSVNSLILLDEIGRGTSTYDGVSIAWAIAEFLCNHPAKPKTLFATHYHELNELEKNNSGIKNFHIQIKETKDKIIFIRKLAEGGSEHSFGIHVAKIAGIPQIVVNRANVILKELESQRDLTPKKNGSININPVQLSMFKLDDPVLEQIKADLQVLDVNTISPIEALMKLHEIKKMIK
ncbi:MAG: DNA mismatch repair protein MutS [Bacteroidetes bacterium]|nr:MAG: DNA mismatch repair protein MutS [Bacteroidota bacterium]